jgi:hypothetical protein
MPSLQAIKSAVKTDEAASKSQKLGFWQQFLGLGAPERDNKEPQTEEPALG